jgi:hypothetical protein
MGLSTTEAPGQALLASGRLIVGRGVTVREVEAEPVHPFWSLTVTEKEAEVVAVRVRKADFCPPPHVYSSVPVWPDTVGVKVKACPSQAAFRVGRATVSDLEGTTVVETSSLHALASVTVSLKVVAAVGATLREALVLPVFQRYE